MDKIVILNQSYPNPNTKDLGSPFVHVRAKFYLDEFDVEVIKISSVEQSYTYEGIKVTCCKNYDEFNAYIKQIKPAAILTHFCEPWMSKTAIENDIPLLVWVHGSEAHSWYRILFTLHKRNIPNFLRFILINTVSLRNFRRMIRRSKTSNKIHFVFVSDWMKRITFFDTFSSTDKYSIIPNAIDTKLFSYKKKDASLRKRILMIRSFNSAKYANDVSVDAILKMSAKPWFRELEFEIYGKGIHWNRLTSKLSSFSNVKLHNKMMEQKDIPSVHKEFGVFLCPTRMDAQGVSMCEAMSSGLVPITTNNTAIPEFVEHRSSGFLTNSSSDLVRSMEYLVEQPDKFATMSEQASASIMEKCGTEKVIKMEKDLIKKMIAQQN